jgi:hypothetical protein
MRPTISVTSQAIHSRSAVSWDCLCLWTDSEGLLLVIPDAFLPQGRALDMSRFNVSFVFAQAASFVRHARAIRVQLDSADLGGHGVKLNFDEVGLIGGSGCPVHDSVRGAASRRGHHFHSETFML